MKWISVKDKTPDEHIMVLCMDKNGRCHVARRVPQDNEKYPFYWEDDRCGCCQLIYDTDIEWWQPIDNVTPMKDRNECT